MKLKIPPIVQKRWPLLLGVGVVAVAAFAFARTRQRAAQSDGPTYSSYIPAIGFINPGGIEPAWLPGPQVSLDEYEPPSVVTPNPETDPSALDALAEPITAQPIVTQNSVSAPAVTVETPVVAQQQIPIFQGVSERYDNYFLIEQRYML